MSGSKAEWREVLSSLGGGLALLRPFFLSLSWNCFHTIYHTQNKRPYATYAKTYAKWNNRNKRNGLSSTEIVSLWLLTDVGFMVEFWHFLNTKSNSNFKKYLEKIRNILYNQSL